MVARTAAKGRGVPTKFPICYLQRYKRSCKGRIAVSRGLASAALGLPRDGHRRTDAAAQRAVGDCQPLVHERGLLEAALTRCAACQINKSVNCRQTRSAAWVKLTRSVQRQPEPDAVAHHALAVQQHQPQQADAGDYPVVSAAPNDHAEAVKLREHKGLGGFETVGG
jgi:hypothetical protein